MVWNVLNVEQDDKKAVRILEQISVTQSGENDRLLLSAITNHLRVGKAHYRKPQR